MLNNIVTSTDLKESIIRNLNPITKLISILLILFTSILSESIFHHLTLILFILVIISLTNIDYQKYIEPIIKMKYFLLMIFIFNLIIQIPIIQNIIFLLRLIELILYSRVITYTTTIYEINYALNVLLKPLKLIKINPNIITTGLTLSIRFIPTIINQVNKIQKSFISKGIQFRNNTFKNKISIIKYIIVNSFLISINKADVVANVMELKYFNLNKDKTYYFKYKFNYKDLLYLSIILFILIEIIKFEVV